MVAIEGEIRLADLQALDGRIALKRRDGGLGSVLLVVADTGPNRRALAVGHESLRASFPLDAREVLSELGYGRLPKAGSVLGLRSGAEQWPHTIEL